MKKRWCFRCEEKDLCIFEIITDGVYFENVYIQNNLLKIIEIKNLLHKNSGNNFLKNTQQKNLVYTINQINGLIINYDELGFNNHDFYENRIMSIKKYK